MRVIFLLNGETLTFVSDHNKGNKECIKNLKTISLSPISPKQLRFRPGDSWFHQFLDNTNENHLKKTLR